MLEILKNIGSIDSIKTVRIFLINVKKNKVPVTWSKTDNVAYSGSTTETGYLTEIRFRMGDFLITIEIEGERNGIGAR